MGRASLKGAKGHGSTGGINCHPFMEGTMEPCLYHEYDQAMPIPITHCNLYFVQKSSICLKKAPGTPRPMQWPTSSENSRSCLQATPWLNLNVCKFIIYLVDIGHPHITPDMLQISLDVDFLKVMSIRCYKTRLQTNSYSVSIYVDKKPQSTLTQYR